MKKRPKLQAAILAALASSSYADDTCLPPDAGSKSPLEVFQCFEAKLNSQQKQMGEQAAENKRQQAKNQALKTQVDTQQQQMGKQQAKIYALKTQVDTQQQQMGKQQAKIYALKTQVEQLSQKLPNQKLPATTENCTSEQTGQIRFDGTYARLCNGTHWQVIDARHPKPVLKPSAKKYTMAEVRETGNGKSWPQLSGQGTICETGYHLCLFMEALVLKYAYPSSRTAPKEGVSSFRTQGTHSHAGIAGSTSPHNALLGYADGGNWNGPSLQCPEGSGPMIQFWGHDRRSLGIQGDVGCYKDEKRLWACCLNNLD